MYIPSDSAEIISGLDDNVIAEDDVALREGKVMAEQFSGVCGGRDLRAVSGLRGKLANVLEAELGGFALCRVADFEAKSYNSDRQDNDKGDKNDVF